MSALTLLTLFTGALRDRCGFLFRRPDDIRADLPEEATPWDYPSGEGLSAQTQEILARWRESAERVRNEGLVVEVNLDMDRIRAFLRAQADGDEARIEELLNG